MKKVTITLGDEAWKWWKDNPWINLSQLAERELNRIKALEERVLGTCPECGNLVVVFQRPMAIPINAAGFTIHHSSIKPIWIPLLGRSSNISPR